MPHRISAVAAALLSVVATPLFAQTVTEFNRLSVVGNRDEINRIAGSAHVISDEELERFSYSDIHRILRVVPGLYIVEEEGLGLRPNIGMRGSGTDRSSRITLLEDGVLVAPAPYAAPAAYYFPTAARMSGVEVRKGSASIKHGPYTVGGALNLLSTPIPAEWSGEVAADAGTDGARNLHAWLGGDADGFGWLVETVQQSTDGFKRLDTGGDTGFSLSDYLVKLRYAPIDSDHGLELKLGATRQDGDETYVGLTLDDFEATPYRRYAGSQLDHIDTEHEQYQLRHDWRINADVDLTTVAYRNDFARAWYKLQSVGGLGAAAVLRDPTTHAAEYAWLTGTTSPDDALVIRNNNRAYYGQGIQSVLGWRAALGDVRHDVELGLRVHSDEEDRLQEDDGYRMDNGVMVLTSAGAPGSNANRAAEAEVVALYVQDEIRAGHWTITPGLRHERIRGTRTDFGANDPTRAAGPTGIRRSSANITIPGIGVNREIGGGHFAFASVHRGFTPSAPGSTSDAEESTNYEFGWRWSRGSARAEVVGFYNDYTNLVGTCTASTGGGCVIGDQFDGGKVAMHGLEAQGGWRWQAGGFQIPVSLSYTLTDAEFETSFVSAFGEFGTVERGDELPYLPPHQARLGVGVEKPRWQLHLGASWVDEMRTTAGTGRPPRTERTDSYLVLDVAGQMQLRPNLALYARVDNLLDNEYLVAWRPAGARPGKPRSVIAGVRWGF
ncbi:MAG: TonB-dependent receptor [Gammaproteobacteria bacterium]